jgi:DNA-binding transcriptional MerR regulator
MSPVSSRRPLGDDAAGAVLCPRPTTFEDCGKQAVNGPYEPLTGAGSGAEIGKIRRLGVSRSPAILACIPEEFRVPVTVTVTPKAFHLASRSWDGTNGHVVPRGLGDVAAIASIPQAALTVPPRAAGNRQGGRPSAGMAISPDDAHNDTPMTIGEVAQEFGMTLRALRFYESKRLINPERRGATRLYRRGDRQRIALILTGRRLGFTLKEISELAGRPEADELQKGLPLSRAQCVEQINLLERQKCGIEVAIAELRQIYTSFYKALSEDALCR